MKVYLSGPISGKADAAILGWRQKVRVLLPTEVELIDPASAHYDSTLAFSCREDVSEAMRRFLHGRVVVDRNRHLIMGSDVLLVNFLRAKKASIGSIGEIFWANSFQIPIVIIREHSGNVHDHAMVNAVASVICESVEDGCTAVSDIMATKTRNGHKDDGNLASSAARTVAS